MLYSVHNKLLLSAQGTQEVVPFYMWVISFYRKVIWLFNKSQNRHMWPRYKARHSAPILKLNWLEKLVVNVTMKFSSYYMAYTRDILVISRHWSSSSYESVFSFLRRLSAWHCSHLPLSCGAAATARRPCSNQDRYLLPTGRTAANPQQQSVAGECWDGRTDRWTRDRYTNAAPRTLCE